MSGKRTVTKVIEDARVKLGGGTETPASWSVVINTGETGTMWFKLETTDEDRKADYPIRVRMTRKDALMLAGVLYESVGILTKTEAE